MIGVRRMACEMHGCCFLANPVVANETTGAGLYTKEKECYQQPLTDYPEWFSLPFGTCSRDCHDANANFDKDDADAEVYPTRYRENVCMFTNGSVASDILCGEPPVNSATCNMHEYCTETGCGTSGCGENGSCERVYYSQIAPRLFNEECVCDIGWSGANCNVRDPACSSTVTEGLGTWVIGSWGDCGPTTPRSEDATCNEGENPTCSEPGMRIRNVKCDCFGTCKNASKPATFESCTYQYAKHVPKSAFGNLLPYRNWIPKEFPDIDIMSHFVMMENREGIASSGGFNLSLIHI